MILIEVVCALILAGVGGLIIQSCRNDRASKRMIEGMSRAGRWQLRRGCYNAPTVKTRPTPADRFDPSAD